MKISWVLADSTALDPELDIDALKRLGAFWGSWRTWRACQTDNVICHDQGKATDLVRRNFQKNCNFYIPNSIYLSLQRPDNVKIYEGSFVHDVDRQEEIVALHLAASTSDIVLLLGFNLAKLEPGPDKLINNRTQHYRNHVVQSFKDYDQVQWVIINHPEKLDPHVANLPNVSTDTLENILITD